jgi:hypothetical protein
MGKWNLIQNNHYPLVCASRRGAEPAPIRQPDRGWVNPRSTRLKSDPYPQCSQRSVDLPIEGAIAGRCADGGIRSVGTWIGIELNGTHIEHVRNLNRSRMPQHAGLRRGE